MKSRGLLLDTQTFLLASQGESSLPPRARRSFLDKRHTLYLSLVSVWELQIKLSLGKAR